MIEEKEEKKGSGIIGIIIVIVIVIGAILLYPFKVSVDSNGVEHCTNLIGVEFNCHESNNP